MPMLSPRIANGDVGARSWIDMPAAPNTLRITTGRSIGKRATETMVVDVASGQTIGYGRALLRTVLSVVGLAAFGVGLLFVLTNRQRRAAHDLVVGTRVISP